MIRTSAICLAAAALTASSALVAKQWVDYTPSKGVWTVTAVDVDANHIDDYLMGLRRTQQAGFDIMRRRGMIDDYKFLVRDNYTKNSPSVIIMVHYVNAAAMEPDKARDQAIDSEIEKTLSEEQGKAAVAAYEKYRTVLDAGSFREITFAK